MFEPTSRYAGIENVKMTVTGTDGQPRVLVFKRRRFIPLGAGATVLVQHTVSQGDRLDNITARYLGDPTQFWRVCDANASLKPSELEEPGRSVDIALPGF
jgi:hypothetical protein